MSNKTTTRYTESQIISFQTEAKESGCTGPFLFWCGKTSELVTICNGIGSDDMPEWSRDALTFIYRNYQTAGAIHDCRYELSDGTEDNRADADEEFRDNCFRLWERRYGWLRWVRPAAYADRAKIKLAYLALKESGGAAWKAAYEKNRKKPEFEEWKQ